MIVRNAIGENVFTSKINAGKTEINLGNQPKGVYLIEIDSADKKIVKKIVLK